MSEITMEVLYSGVFQYQIPQSPKVPLSQCTIDIVRYNNGVYCVIMSENKNNKGISVTNACDRIATQAYAKFLTNISPDKIVWLEHSPASRMHKAHLDLIQFQHTLKEGTVSFTNPQWKRFSEASQIVPVDFLRNYGYILKELCNANMIFAIEDKSNHHWRVWANPEGFFIVSSNPAAALPDSMLDAPGVTVVLKSNAHLFGPDIDIEGQFTAALMSGFLNKGL
ncbi:MAG: hypothetical protein M1610_10040 [Nitrospirae bacterium]|nr:hypothetical protein [Nitrospirota bacterium]MDA8214679.1 hypothetical protein [Nitrospiraceae bacterium]